MTAVARHFGSEVATYAIWNEPNHPAFLLPQFNSNGTPASPRIYRGLYQAGYAGLQAAGLTHPRGAVRRNRPHRLRLGQEPAPDPEIQGPAARRGAARVPARSAVPELPLPASRLLQRAADDRLRAPRLHDRGGPELQDPGSATTSRSGCSRGSPTRSISPPGVHALPARVPIYLTEFGVQSMPNKQLGVPVSVQAEYDAIAEQIAYEQPPRGGLLAVPAQGRPARRGARGERQRRHRRLPDRAWSTPTAAPSRSTTAGRCRWWSASAATATRCGASCARPTGPTTVTVLVRWKGSRRYRTLRNVTTNSAGLLELQLHHPGRPLARALDEPGRRALRRPADPRLTEAQRRRAPDGPVAAYDEEAMPELPEVEITARLLDRAPAGSADRVRAGAPGSTP